MPASYGSQYALGKDAQFDKTRPSTFVSPAKTSAEQSSALGAPMPSARHGRFEARTCLRRTASTRDAHNTRGVSPPRTKAEQPRHALQTYADHRSVSPLGSSRFERPSISSHVSDRSLTRRSCRKRETASNDTRPATAPAYSHGSGLHRRNAVHGRGEPRRRGTLCAREIDTHEFRSGLTRLPEPAANFENGGFSTWERY